MIMGSKEGFGTGVSIPVQVFHYGSGNTQAIIGARPSANLVQNNQAVGRAIVENVGRFIHFDHKS